MKTTTDERGMESVPIGRKLSVTISRSKKYSKQDKSTQTILRDSQTQTSPWRPEIIFRKRKDGERIPLELFGFPGEGPLSMGDLTVMEKVRQKHAWESTLPRTSSKKNDVIRVSCISSIATNEMTRREASLNAENEERIELSRELMKKNREEALVKLEERLKTMKSERSKENVQIIEYWNRQFKRNMRKLNRCNLKIKDESDYGTKRTCFISPRESIPGEKTRSFQGKKLGFSRYLAEFSGMEMLEKQIVLSPFKFSKCKKTLKTTGTCSRARRKAEKELENLGMIQSGKESEKGDGLPRTSLRRRIGFSFGKCESEIAKLEEDEEVYQASLLLGKIVKGRAVQTRLFPKLIELRSRRNCQD